MVRRLFPLIFIALSPCYSQPSGAVRLLSHYIPPQGGSFIGGSWGWTDTLTGKEYALLGCYCGTSIVEISVPGTPVERSFIPGVCSEWREIQTYSHYAYVVSEGGGGTQIIDLSYLPDSAHQVKYFNYSSGGNNISRSHTLHIKDGYMYLNGCANWSAGGIVVFSLADPVNPLYKSAYEREYIHDCFVRNDTIYGAGIYGQGVDIIDATNKTSLVHLYQISYAGAGTHNCSTTMDGKYLLTTDEIGSTPKTLKVWDLQSPPSFPKVAEYVGSPTAIVHNVFVKGTKAYMSYYTKGLKIVDISNPAAPIEIGGYDSYPADDHTDYTGAWSTYPFFPSGRIIIGDMVSALYVVDLDTLAPGNTAGFKAYSDYVTPTSVHLTWTDPTSTVVGGPITGLKIHIYRDGAYIAQVDSGVQTYSDTGLTQHQFYTYTAVASISGDSSGGTNSSAYAGGHAVPQSPTSFNALSAVGGVMISWTNPRRQLDDTPLNDLAAIRIRRDGGTLIDIPQTSADTGAVRTYFDSVTNYHTYDVEAYDNETPTHYSSPTSPKTVWGNVLLNYNEGFEAAPLGLLRTGTWDTTSALSHSGGKCYTDSPSGNYLPSTTSYIQTPPVILGSNPVLQFSHIAIIAYGDIGYVEISKNGGTSFTVLKPYNLTMRPEWSDSVANPGDWYTDVFNLAAYAGDTVVVRFRLVTNTSGNTDGWYIDDILIGDPATPMSINQSTQDGWNMISLPIIVPDGRKGTVYPDALSKAFTYSGGYVGGDSLIPGTGYWLKFSGSTTRPFSGIWNRRDTIDVQARWNMIGTTSGKIRTSSVKSIPTGIVSSNYFGYNGGYQIAQALEPGKAYWVKASQSGKLVVSEYQNGAVPGELPKENFSGDNRLTFKDAAGRSQTLYYSEKTEAPAELPPVPPEGSFDIRYASGRLNENIDDSPKILLQGIKYPVKVSWESDERNGLLIIDGREYSLRSGGTVNVSQPASEIKLREGRGLAEPEQLSLWPNYPNPFNPATELRYDIQAQSYVSLKIYSMLGQEVATLVSAEREAGSYRVTWDGGNAPSGVYYARLIATDAAGKEYSKIQKLTLIR